MAAEPTVRCYQCGARIPENRAIRRNVRTGATTGRIGLDPTRLENWLSAQQFERVDLCPGCDQKRAAREKLERRMLALALGVLALAATVFVCAGVLGL